MEITDKDNRIKELEYENALLHLFSFKTPIFI